MAKAQAAMQQGRGADYVVIEVTVKTKSKAQSPKTRELYEDEFKELADRIARGCQMTLTDVGVQICKEPAQSQATTRDRTISDEDRLAEQRKRYGSPTVTMEDGTRTYGLIYTRSGEWYAFSGYVGPTQAERGTFSMRYGWLDTPGTPTDEQVANFVGGMSASVALSAGGVQAVFTTSMPGFEMSGFELGYTSGGAGLSWSFTAGGKVG